MGNKKLIWGVLMVVFGFFVALFLTAGSANAKRLQEKYLDYNQKSTRVIDIGGGGPNPYSAGIKNPINWGGLQPVDPAFPEFTTREYLEKHNLVIRITKAGLNEISELISDIISSDPSFANLVNYLVMSFLDKCTDTRVLADFWDSLYDFQQWLTREFSNDAAKYYYYQELTRTACGIPSSPNFNIGEGDRDCFGNDIYFEYIGGYNPTGTWDGGTNQCKDDGKGIFSACLPIPLLNDEGAPLCVNAIIYGQEKNKQPSGNPSNPIRFLSGGFVWSPLRKCAMDLPNICPTSDGWIGNTPPQVAPYFLDQRAGSRLILDFNRTNIVFRLEPNIGTDIPGTWQCEGDRTEHTSDDRLDIIFQMKNFEISLTFASPYVPDKSKYVDCNWVGGSCEFKTGVTQFTSADQFCFVNRRAVNSKHICDPQYNERVEGFVYDPARVISNYINGRAHVRIPIFTFRLGIQIKGNFTDWTSHLDWEHMVRGLGINLKALDVTAGIAYDFIPMSASVTTPACHDKSWNQVGSAQYCPEYRVSQKFAKTLLWFDAVIRAIAADFNAACVSGHTPQQYDTCIAYYLFPGQVIDLKGILADRNPILEHPFEEVVWVGPTQYYEHRPNRIFIDFGFTNDFWADSAGIIIAANVATDIRYVAWTPTVPKMKDVKKAGFNGYVTSCVQFAGLTPPPPATSPITPIPECNIVICPPADRTVDTCTIVNGGSTNYVFKNETLPSPPVPEGRYGYPSLDKYYIGIGIHHNLISRFLYEAIGDGLACIWVDKYTPQLGGFAGGVLKTDAFGFFMPKLKDVYGGKDMALEIIPLYKDPGNPSGNSGGAASYNLPASVVAYAKTGGPTFRPVLSVYSESSTRVDFWREFVDNATYGSSFTMFVQPSTWFDRADLMIDIPYVDLSFNVISNDTSLQNPVASQAWMRVFGLTVGIRLSVDLDIVPCSSADCKMTKKFPPLNDTDFEKPLTSYYVDYYGNSSDLSKGGNYFPSGGTFARVIDLTLYVDPDVRYFIAYNTNALGLSNADWAEILANILPVMLNMVAGAKIRLALDPAAMFQIPISINFPWVGPEFESAVALPWDTQFPGDPASGDNIGDYFEIFMHWQGRGSLAAIVSTQGIFGIFGIDIIDVIDSITGGALLGSSPKAVNLYRSDWGSTDGFKVTPPETFITYTSDPHALYTKIEFAAWSPHSSKFRYSWRLDGGTWNLWQRENSVVLHHLLEGWHVFEVRAQDENKFIDPTPARYVFRIDSLGPDIKLTAPEMVRGSKFKAFVDVQDAQAKKSETLVSWKVDDGEWSEWVPASELTSIEINSLAKGEHILHIRAKDDVGNTSTYSHRFFATEKVGVLGCSSASAAGLLPLIGMILIGFAIISRRLRK
jgi:hypothetical protein